MYANGSHAGNNHSLYRVKWAADRFAIDSSSVYFDFHDCFKYPPRHDTQAIVKFNRGNISRPRSNDLYAGCTRRFGMQIRHEGQWKRRQVSTKPSTSWQFTRAPDSFTVGYLSSGVRRVLKEDRGFAKRSKFVGLSIVFVFWIAWKVFENVLRKICQGRVDMKC